jgi:hypothetical protein
VCQVPTSCFKDMAKTFCANHHHLLLSPEDDTTIRQLASIYQTCATLALKMWKMKRDIVASSLKMFNKRAASGQSGGSFMHNSPETVPDSTMQLKPRGDSLLDGRPICIVITPLVCAWFQSGKDKALTEKVVWSKAIVWASNKKLKKRNVKPDSDGMDKRSERILY